MQHSGICILLIAFATLFEAAIIPEHTKEYETVEYEDKLPELQEQWFEQYLNHFDVFHNNTFYQRYFEDDTFFKPGGPFILEIGGESAISADSIRITQSYLLAEKLHGTIFLLEHRYYGKSSPYENLTRDNLYYLSVEQALEDLAYFVETIKRTTPGLERSKVGVFGCSYAGSLATWFRYKFPHIVDAAWAGSSPLRAVADFYEYFEVASAVYANVSKECINTIKEGYEETKQLLSTPEGKELIKSTLGYWGCGNITEMDDNLILSYIRLIVADYIIPLDHGTESCELLTYHKKDSSAFEALAIYLLNRSSSFCSRYDSRFPNDGIAWIYQTCTEFGFTVTTTSKKQPFNESRKFIDEYLNICIESFGEGISKEVLQRGIDRINRVYGSVNLKVTHVLSIHGEQDPWYRLGLYEQNHEDAPVIFIPGISHCVAHFDTEGDSLALRRANSKAQKIMMEWLK